MGLTAPPGHSPEGTAVAMATRDRPPWRPAYSSLVGLDVAEVDLPGLQVMPMHRPAVLARLGLPGGDGAPVEAEGRDDGGHGAAAGEQGDDAEERGLALVQAEEGVPLVAA